MTEVRFKTEKGVLCGFTVSGHSTCDSDDVSGKTVCAAVSSAAYMAANTIIEVIGDKYSADVRDGFMEIEVSDPSEKTEAVLKGLKLHLTELSKQYGKQIRIITEV